MGKRELFDTTRVLAWKWKEKCSLEISLVLSVDYITSTFWFKKKITHKKITNNINTTRIAHTQTQNFSHTQAHPHTTEYYSAVPPALTLWHFSCLLAYSQHCTLASTLSSPPRTSLEGATKSRKCSLERQISRDLYCSHPNLQDIDCVDKSGVHDRPK